VLFLQSRGHELIIFQLRQIDVDAATPQLLVRGCDEVQSVPLSERLLIQQGKDKNPPSLTPPHKGPLTKQLNSTLAILLSVVNMNFKKYYYRFI